VDLGGGRRKKGDAIDHSVGVVLYAKTGDYVEQGAPLCEVHAANETTAEAAVDALHDAFTLSDHPVAKLPVVYERITAEDGPTSS